MKTPTPFELAKARKAIRARETQAQYRRRARLYEDDMTAKGTPRKVPPKARSAKNKAGDRAKAAKATRAAYRASLVAVGMTPDGEVVADKAQGRTPEELRLAAHLARVRARLAPLRDLPVDAVDQPDPPAVPDPG